MYRNECAIRTLYAMHITYVYAISRPIRLCTNMYMPFKAQNPRAGEAKIQWLHKMVGGKLIFYSQIIFFPLRFRPRTCNKTASKVAKYSISLADH